MNHRCFYVTVALFLFSSCTMILSTNIPGRKEKSLPEEWQGRYQVITESYFPEKRDSAKHKIEYATIESTRITWESNDGIKIYKLDDSLRYSVIPGKGQYLSLLMPQGLYAVFRVLRKGEMLELQSLSSDDEPKKAELNRYFDKVERVKKGEDEYYKVTIVEKKLDAYFDSSIPSTEITKLIPLK